jgi:hypothetical protein
MKSSLLRHPIVQAGLSLIVVRMIVLFVMAVLAGAPSWTETLLSFLSIAAWHAGEAVLLIAIFLLVWKTIPILRIPISGIALPLFMVLLFLSVSDPILQSIIGERLTPSTLRHFKGPSLFVSDNFWMPVKANWIRVSLALSGLAAYVGWLAVLFVHKGLRPRDTPVGILQPVSLLAFGAILVVVPGTLSSRPIMQPVEVAYFKELVGLDKARLDIPDKTAVERIRNFVGLPPGARWLDSRYPLVYAPGPDAGKDIPAIERPDVILIGIESLRAENLRHINPNASWYVETPNLQRMAKQGVVFPRYISNGFPTGPGYISLTYSVWPHPQKRIIPEFKHISLDGLSQRLRGLGYTTVHVEGDPNFDRKSAWIKGNFSDEIDLSTLRVPQTQKQLVDHLIAWMTKQDRRKTRKPIFAVMLTPQPHMPYEWPADETERLDFGESLVENYKHSLNYVDTHLGRLFRYLEARDRGKNTVIIVTGDHANFADQKKTVSIPVNDTMWTSAIIVGPKQLIGEPRAEAVPASHVDLHPTILKLVGDGRPTANLGRDLLHGPGRTDPYALAVRNGGTRVDMGTVTRILDGHSSDLVITQSSFPFDSDTKKASGKFPLAPSTIAEAVRIWTYLLEANRVWNPKFLGGDDAGPKAKTASR